MGPGTLWDDVLGPVSTLGQGADVAKVIQRGSPANTDMHSLNGRSYSVSC